MIRNTISERFINSGDWGYVDGILFFGSEYVSTIYPLRGEEQPRELDEGEKSR